MGETVQVLFVKSNLLKDLFHHFPALCFGADLIYLKRRTDQIVNRHSWIQGAVWILENDLQLPAHFPHFFLVIGKNVFPVIKYLSFCCRNQAENGSAKSGFSAAGLSYQTQGLSFIYSKAYMVYRFYLGWLTVQKTFFPCKIFG